MRALAITGIETASMMPSIMSGSLIRETPPCARMSAGTRSRAITATAPASSAILACSGVTTSMITPPLSISAMPRLTRVVPVTGASWVSSECCSAMPARLVLLGVRSRFGIHPGGGCGEGLAADLEDPLQHRDRAQHGDEPERHLVEDRQVEQVAEEGGHQQPDQPVGTLRQPGLGV